MARILLSDGQTGGFGLAVEILAVAATFSVIAMAVFVCSDHQKEERKTKNDALGGGSGCADGGADTGDGGDGGGVHHGGSHHGGHHHGSGHHGGGHHGGGHHGGGHHGGGGF